MRIIALPPTNVEPIDLADGEAALSGHTLVQEVVVVPMQSQSDRSAMMRTRKFVKERTAPLPKAAAYIKKSSISSTHATPAAKVEREERPGLLPDRRLPTNVHVRPTVDTLEQEVILDGWKAPIEWHLLTAEEIACAAAIREWLGGETFSQIPYDLLITFIRGFSYRVDWHSAAFAFLDAALDWRRAEGCDAVLAAEGTSGFTAFAPQGVPEFDQLFPAGIIGRDREGHLVVLDRLFAAPSATMLSRVSDDDYIRHSIARREVFRAAASANAARTGRRLYHCVWIVDASGLSLGHVLNSKLHARWARCFELFGYRYPETMNRTVVVNAPRIVTGLWAVMRRFLHPLTVARVSILGTNYAATLAAEGITLPDGKLPSELRPWIDELAALKAEHPVELLTRGYIPDADRRALDAL